MKTVFVTGAASGIGQAIGTALAEEGHRVILSDVNKDGVDTLVEALKQKGCKVEAFEMDVSQQSAIDLAGQHFPHVDVLINNAGIQYVAKLESFPAERWRLINDILLVGPAMLTRTFIAGMKHRNFGRIINIGSIHAMVASPYKSAYVAAKHGLLGFSKVTALETAEFDITINTICPSYVKTPLVEKQISQQAQEHNISEAEVVNNIMLSPMPKKAFIEMEELVGSVQYLMSPAARNMTGQTMVLDGGWTAR
ncbi:D-beta-hydroxybutyrate dehydrogenase [Thalassocella blandensis]|nr:D-beta-hydroxybutyrate dehydrogenase [Thalassocella blandensis]